MSNTNEWYEDDDFDTEDDFGSDNAVKNLRKADRAKAKQIKELETELESLRKFQRESVITTVLKDKGVNPKIAAFIPSNINNDAEEISKWLEEYGEIFNMSPAPSAQANQAREVVDPNLAALRQMDSVVNNALSSEDVTDAFSRLNNAESMEDIINMINGF